MRHSAAALLLCAALACGGTRSDGPDPEQVVVKFFAAVDAGDCTTMTSLAGGELAAKIGSMGCPKLLESYRHLDMHLVAIENVEVDGRNPSARIIRTRLRFGKKPREGLLRVEKQGKQWRIVLL